MKHTPKKWIVDAFNWLVDNGSERGPKPIVSMDGISKQDAALIAAAPELLEALKDIIADDEVSNGDLPQELVNLAKMAIYRAEGRQ